VEFHIALFVGNGIPKSHNNRIKYLQLTGRKGFWATTKEARNGLKGNLRAQTRANG